MDSKFIFYYFLLTVMLELQFTDADLDLLDRQVQIKSLHSGQQFVVKSGATTKMKCMATCSPKCDILWYKSGVQIVGGESTRDKFYINSNTYEPDTSSLLQINKLNRSDAGTYNCKAVSGKAEKFLDVPINMVIEGPPIFTIDPLDLQILSGRGFTLKCNASGPPEPVTVKWFQNGKEISSVKPQICSGKNIPELHVKQGISEATNFSCFASNSFGKGVFSRQATVQPLVPPAPPALRVSRVESTSAVVQWKIVFDGFSSVTSLTIQYGEISQPSDLISFVVHNTTKRQEKLFPLKPYHKYVVRAKASNAIGESKWSESLLFTSAEDVPSPPRLIQGGTDEVSGRPILTWHPPDKPNGQITGYVIEIKQPGQEPQLHITDGRSRKFYLDDITTSNQFTVRLKAQSKVGTSQAVPNPPLRVVNGKVVYEADALNLNEHLKHLVRSKPELVLVSALGCVIVSLLSALIVCCCRSKKKNKQRGIPPHDLSLIGAIPPHAPISTRSSPSSVTSIPLYQGGNGIDNATTSSLLTPGSSHFLVRTDTGSSSGSHSHLHHPPQFPTAGGVRTSTIRDSYHDGLNLYEVAIGVGSSELSNQGQVFRRSESTPAQHQQPINSNYCHAYSRLRHNSFTC